MERRYTGSWYTDITDGLMFTDLAWTTHCSGEVGTQIRYEGHDELCFGPLINLIFTDLVVSVRISMIRAISGLFELCLHISAQTSPNSMP